MRQASDISLTEEISVWKRTSIPAVLEGPDRLDQEMGIYSQPIQEICGKKDGEQKVMHSALEC